jgi:hypothetical protein
LKRLLTILTRMWSPKGKSSRSQDNVVKVCHLARLK